MSQEKVEKRISLKPKPQYTASQILADLESEIRAALQEAAAHEEAVQIALQQADAKSLLDTGDVTYAPEATFPEMDAALIVIAFEFASKVGVITYKYILERLKKRAEVDEV